MMRCLQLAKNGVGKTYPNPMVGCVIVHANRIIGEGWHEKAGKDHAEVIAIRSVQDKTLLSEATIYINLEPCSHFGKTPPCADLIISTGIKNVIIGCQDPNPKVGGMGIRKLEKQGLHVEVGICEKKCIHLNKRFFSFHLKNRPYIILKWAQSKDGFLAPVDTLRSSEKTPAWITNGYSRQLVHKMRSQEAAILIGTNTVMMDDPTLTTRFWEGNSPLRLVIDRNLKIPDSSVVLDGNNKTIVLTSSNETNHKKVEYEILNFEIDLVPQISKLLFQRNIQSLIVEGGTKTIQSFINSNYWDEAVVFKGDVELKDGIAAPKLHDKSLTKTKIKKDKILFYKNNSL